MINMRLFLNQEVSSRFQVFHFHILILKKRKYYSVETEPIVLNALSGVEVSDQNVDR